MITIKCSSPYCRSPESAPRLTLNDAELTAIKEGFTLVNGAWKCYRCQGVNKYMNPAHKIGKLPEPKPWLFQKMKGEKNVT